MPAVGVHCYAELSISSPVVFKTIASIHCAGADSRG